MPTPSGYFLSTLSNIYLFLIKVKFLTKTDAVIWTLILCCFPPAPVFYFGDAEYHVDESQSYVDVRVWRTGTDLSKAATVTVRSRKTDPVSAEGTEQHRVCPKVEWKALQMTGVCEFETKLFPLTLPLLLIRNQTSAHTHGALCHYL